MKKILSVLLILTLISTITACGSKETDKLKEEPKTEEVTETEDEREEESPEEEAVSQPINEEHSSENDEEKENNSNSEVSESVFEKNNSKVYPNVDEVVDIKMGVVEDGKKVPLFTIKVPTNWGCGSMYMDENGSVSTSSDMPGFLGEAVETGYMNDYLPKTLAFTASGVKLHMVIDIYTKEESTVEMTKDFSPNGFDINEGDKHEAYIFDLENAANEDYKTNFAYKINDNWTLMIRCDTPAATGLSLQEVANEFYSLITPIDESEDNDDNVSSVETITNKTKVFPDSEKLVEIAMGVNNGGTDNPLVKVQLPSEYMLIGAYMDEAGNKENDHAEMHAKLSLVIEHGGLDKYLPCEALMSSYGESQSMYSFVIVSSSKMSVEDAREQYPGGVEIRKGDSHELYAYENGESWVLGYYIDDDWVLGVSYVGDAQKELSIDEWAREIDSLITPIN